MRNDSGTLYRQIAAEGATYVGLLIVVYDTLSADLRRAGDAVAAGDIRARCAACNHALLLLGHLDSWAAAMDEVPLRTSLADFYAYLRASVLALQTHASATPFYELATHVIGLRATWQQKFHDRPAKPPSAPEEAAPAHHAGWSA